MKFLYSVIGDNTAENREWLEMVGYEEAHKSECPCRYLYATKEGYYMQSPILSSYAENNDFVDCIGNDKLFRAVSSMRDDSDYMQWFVCKISYRSDIKDIWHFCERPSMDEDSRFFGFISFRKATLSELINHFKQK